MGWPVALDTFVTRIRAVQAEHGPASVAFLSTGQIATEEMALLGALAKFGMGMVHGDGNTRQCMATAVVAYKQSFGFDAPPYTYADLESSDVIVLVGSNVCIAHPILWERICRNPHDPEIVVIDPGPPRRPWPLPSTWPWLPSPTWSCSTAWPGASSSAAPSMGPSSRPTPPASTLLPPTWRFTPAVVAEATGLAPEALERLTTTVAKGKRVSLWWTMGVNQSHEGVLVAQAIINVALLTGNIGRPGTGANSITGQCNAMGSRLFSNTTNLFGGRDFARADDRDDVAEVLGIDAGRIPARPSLAYDQIVEGIATGDIRGLWVVATNSAHSWINHSVGRISTTCWAASTSSWSRTSTPPPRRRSGPTWCCRRPGRGREAVGLHQRPGRGSGLGLHQRRGAAPGPSSLEWHTETGDAAGCSTPPTWSSRASPPGFEALGRLRHRLVAEAWGSAAWRLRGLVVALGRLRDPGLVGRAPVTSGRLRHGDDLIRRVVRRLGGSFGAPRRARHR